MKRYDGQARTEYQDLMRALGHFADEQGLRWLRMLEVEEGLLLQGVRSRPAGADGPEPTLVSRLFTEEDLTALLQRDYRRRRRPCRASPRQPGRGWPPSAGRGTSLLTSPRRGERNAGGRAGGNTPGRVEGALRAGAADPPAAAC